MVAVHAHSLLFDSPLETTEYPIPTANKMAPIIAKIIPIIP
jgi:hypothetical protein